MDLRILLQLPLEAQGDLLEAASYQFVIADRLCQAHVDSSVRCPFCDAEPWAAPVHHRSSCLTHQWGAGSRRLAALVKATLTERLPEVQRLRKEIRSQGNELDIFEVDFWDTYDGGEGYE